MQTNSLQTEAVFGIVIIPAKTKSTDEKIAAAVYCRVSTRSEMQECSLENPPPSKHLCV